MDYLTVRAVQPGQYLLAQLADVPELGWTWIWHLYPSGEGATRLVVRMRIQAAATTESPVVTFVIDVGGFVMERRMMQGVKDRAEGRFDSPYSEAVEIVLWLVALIEGLAAAVLFLVRSEWRRSLAVGIAAVIALLILTFVQPPIWVRASVDAVLMVGLIFFVLPKGGWLEDRWPWVARSHF